MIGYYFCGALLIKNVHISHFILENYFKVSLLKEVIRLEDVAVDEFFENGLVVKHSGEKGMELKSIHQMMLIGCLIVINIVSIAILFSY